MTMTTTMHYDSDHNHNHHTNSHSLGAPHRHQKAVRSALDYAKSLLSTGGSGGMGGGTGGGIRSPTSPTTTTLGGGAHPTTSPTSPATTTTTAAASPSTTPTWKPLATMRNVQVSVLERGAAFRDRILKGVLEYKPGGGGRGRGGGGGTGDHSDSDSSDSSDSPSELRPRDVQSVVEWPGCRVQWDAAFEGISSGWHGGGAHSGGGTMVVLADSLTR